MWDWILVSEVLNSIGNDIFIYIFIPCMVLGIISYIRYLTGDLKEGELSGLMKWIKKYVLFIIIFSFITEITNIPSLMLKANIMRVKINYTSPQSIAKIESSALEVVNKLDKLIDKGIESIGTKDTLGQ